METHQANRPDVVLGFIVGMSRGGTTWVSSSLARHPEIVVIGETWYWGRKYLQPELDGYYSITQQRVIIERLTREGLVNVLPEEIGTPERRQMAESRRAAVDTLKNCRERLTPKELFSAICKTVSDSERKKWVIEKTPHHILCIHRITSAYPEARFIVMYREPYSFMLSYKHRPVRSQGIKRTSLYGMYHPIGCALVWRGYARSILKVMQEHSSRCLLIEHSQIRECPGSVLSDIQEFLGVKQCADNLASGTRFSSFCDDKRPVLHADDIFWMNFIARKEIKQLGVERKHSGLFLFPVLKSVLVLPLYMFRVRRFLGKRWHSSIAYIWSWVVKK